MDSQKEQQAGSSKDTALLIASALLLVGGLSAFYYFIGQYNVLVRTLILLASIGAALFAAYQTHMGRVMWSYINGAYRIEARKVVWPSRQESIQATLMIAVVVLISALLLWGLDSALLWGVKTLTGRG
ncbi:preprotein translocase subunit SecE [Stenotrophobium rhamnosiphilum]|uniref:Preprotein translocase subunit SecE n=1 Tax=Stenotrophobium rhamnosiphilum TaxID=2029166 RepID=A0A2T5MB11_9GAMM|nr:preprotein translocase subunit SecE [Stenotrophobium rhamnosiphilum]PTU28199.1 preprotein translocase subunit SecE [Stenotrophobium rhamnosiphilum]